MNGKHLPPLRIEPQEAIALFAHAKERRCTEQKTYTPPTGKPKERTQTAYGTL